MTSEQEATTVASQQQAPNSTAISDTKTADAALINREAPGTITVCDNDVLLGRGGQTNKHAGNKRYRQVVTSFQEKYLNSKKKEKIVIARQIVSIIHQNGGRFLKLDGDDWQEVTDKRAQEKTSQALREGLDVRNKTLRANGKSPRRDSEPSSATPPRKRAKTTPQKQQQPPNSPVPPSMVSVDGTSDAPAIGTQAAGALAPPAPISFLTYKPQLSKSDVTDVCAL